MNAEFTPNKNTLKHVDTFRHWCQKVLPLVYDDSLSYYELLCKVTNYLNETISNVDMVGEDIGNLYNAYTQLQGYVNDYFSELDVQEEIDVKLDNMAKSGDLDVILRPLFNEYDAQIKVLDSRVTNLASLESGSTTGDAELVDARVDYNGNTWDSVGDHVRGVTGQLSSEINNLCLKGDVIVNPNFHEAPYDDLNTFPVNKIVNVGGYKPANCPLNTAVFTASVVTLSHKNELVNGSVQFFITRTGDLYARGYQTSWNTWKKFASLDSDSIVKTSNVIVNPNFHDAPYDDMNTLPVNTIISYGGYTPLNSPFYSTRKQFSGIVLTLCHSETLTNNAMQIVVDKWGNLYNRVYANSVWKQWSNDIQDYMSISLFEKIGVIGDSYASGTIYKSDGDSYGMKYNLSWGQIMARQNGISCLNLSSGGLATAEWLEHSKGLPLLNSSEEQNLYIIALGINDVKKRGVDYIGTIDDIGTDNDSFYADYSKVIEAIKTKAPNSKIICFTISGYGSDFYAFTDAIIEIAEHYGLPYVKVDDLPLIASTVFWDTMKSGHPIALTYSAMAKAYAKAIEQCMANYIEYFADYH